MDTHVLFCFEGETQDCEVAALLPESNERMNLSSEGIFVLVHPDGALTSLYREVASRPL